MLLLLLLLPRPVLRPLPCTRGGVRGPPTPPPLLWPPHACREAAQLARSLAGMHGGLPALLAATAGEAPSAATHLVPGAAAIASALFVAANEFASPDAAAEATLLADAELLLQGAEGGVGGGGGGGGGPHSEGCARLLLLLPPHVRLPAAWLALHMCLARCRVSGLLADPPPLPSPRRVRFPAVCQDAGCLNLAAALALLLGDQDSLERFAVQHAVEWQTLYNLISNDVHLCGYAPVLSPAPSPAVGGGRSVGGLLAA